MSEEAEPEEAVRAYLRAIGEPPATAGPPLAGRLEQSVGDDDPLEQLRALAAVDRARSVRLDALRRGFVRHARRWAIDNDVPRATFRRFGVDDAVLDAAGVGVEGRRRGTVARAGGPGERVRPTTAEQIKDHVRAGPGASPASTWPTRWAAAR